jgi:putative ubiquitin-RnfH superfamily antitoxin RatB of RatAB toxin-antitoxin module
LRVTVVFARPDAVRRVELELSPGSTVRDALAQSGLLPNGALEGGAVMAGAFGEVLPPYAPLRDGDRVEIYRELQITPKDARRFRAAKKRR